MIQLILDILKKIFDKLPVKELAKKAVAKVKAQGIKRSSPVAKFPDRITITGPYPKYASNLKKHNGLDLASKLGYTFLSICNGEVLHAKKGKKGVSPSSQVKIRPKGKDYYVIYKHCNPCVKKFDLVRTGQEIGKADNTGKFRGAHLHIEFKSLKGKILEPVAMLHELQPRLKFRLLQGRWNGRSLKDIFTKYNPEGWKILEKKLK